MTMRLPTGDLLNQNRNAAIIQFSGNRKVLSTAALNGGMHTDLTGVYNHNDCPRAGAWCKMQGDTMEAHQSHTACKLGLDPLYTSGLHTGANIDNMAIQTMQYDDFSVTALVTGGIEVNACRVGNHTDWHEQAGKARMISGTINIILLIDADLSDGCMARALVTCTEAKSAAVQELMVSDRYSCGLATGSGTDGTIIISNSDSPTKLCEAGEAYKLGEYIGKTVIKAVKEALYRQSGLCCGKQHDVFRRLERFGVTEQSTWEQYCKETPSPVTREVFRDMMEKMSADGSIVTFASLYAHLIDQMRWGLLLPQEAKEGGDCILELMNRHHGMPNGPKSAYSDNPEQLTQHMANAFIATANRWVDGSDH